jgi:hypothetical protein
MSFSVVEVRLANIICPLAEKIGRQVATTDCRESERRRSESVFEDASSLSESGRLANLK